LWMRSTPGSNNRVFEEARTIALPRES
jgi:hypothetical protein